MSEGTGVNATDIRPISHSLQKVKNSVKNLLAEVKWSSTMQEGHNKAAYYNNTLAFWVHFGEVIVFLGICGFNVYHIKDMLNNRRIV